MTGVNPEVTEQHSSSSYGRGAQTDLGHSFTGSHWASEEKKLLTQQRILAGVTQWRVQEPEAARLSEESCVPPSHHEN